MELQNSVTLKHLLIDQKKCIGLQFNPNKVVQALIDTLPDLSWSTEFLMFYVLNNKTNFTCFWFKAYFKFTCRAITDHLLS